MARLIVKEGIPEMGNALFSMLGYVKMWVIGQKVCVTNPNKLENL